MSSRQKEATTVVMQGAAAAKRKVLQAGYHLQTKRKFAALRREMAVVVKHLHQRFQLKWFGLVQMCQKPWVFYCQELLTTRTERLSAVERHRKVMRQLLAGKAPRKGKLA